LLVLEVVGVASGLGVSKTLVSMRFAQIVPFGSSQQRAKLLRALLHSLSETDVTAVVDGTDASRKPATIRASGDHVTP
jgi:hypothetical protein